MSLPEDGRSRVVIERVTPEIDAGRFAIKRIVGDVVTVEADVFADGHDELSVEIDYRSVVATVWQSARMTPLGNDRWIGQFRVEHLGEYEYTIRAWVDRFRTWRRDLIKRLDAGQKMTVDARIGADLIALAQNRATGDDRTALADWQQQVASGHGESLRLAATNSGLLALMDQWSEPLFPVRYDRDLRITVDRERARFSAWYELFPRSAGKTQGMHGTLRDVIDRLPDLAAMGFDVVYLPPIHPIGRTYRKGRNNAVSAAAGDVGSPWAIGAAEGGHKSILPELGTFADFEVLVSGARALEMEIALDIAFQCAPDHPYVSEHPGWFRQRPDGTIQYAENPPKKYQDIYPFDFECADWQGLWRELKSVFEFWIERGVRTFRVDNPHTKPFAFWEWCLGELKGQYPDLIFLSEAFTRPAVMYRLAKLGFTQSYTYFAWRHSARDFTEYCTELTQTEIAEFFQPSFWPNTPDILTAELQTGGRPAFVRRLILAATLSSSYGIYGPPFEHQWSAAREPGSEEYLYSEKYEIHHHDWERPDSLRGLIALVNRIRRQHSALHANAGLRFHPVDNDQLLCYSKTSATDNDRIVVVVNLDGINSQSGFVHLPLQEWGLDPQRPFMMHDLLTDTDYDWLGPRNYVDLPPHRSPAHVFVVGPNHG
jgi:starch synthase (maltosyl-transferring)